MLEVISAGAGFLGSVINKGIDLWGRKQERAHELRLRDEDRQDAIIAHDKQIDLASWDGMRASIEAESSIGDSYKWVNAMRACIRPVLTIGLVGASVIYPEVQPITSMASLSVGWWFGDRTSDLTRTTRGVIARDGK